MDESPRHPGLAHNGSRPHRRLPSRPRFAAVALLLAFAAASLALAAPRPIQPLRPPRTADAIRTMLSDGPHAGDCEQCHTTHGDDQPIVYPNALTSPNDNALCARCHATAWAGGSFATEELYRATSHGSSTRMIWPGPEPPMRIEIDAATKCLNCHDPHGWSDNAGPIPNLGLQREEKLCLRCHDGSPATDIARQFSLPYRHPAGDVAGRHAGPLENAPADFAVSPVNQRHAECEDCHNPHFSRADQVTPLDTEASRTTLGASRVMVLNGPPGAPPAYTFVAGSDTLSAPNAEYQLCFKCHSSWTTQPSGQTDMALVLNPANPSFHPVEEAGRNTMIAAGSFVPGWGPNSITRCGSCHRSDAGGAEGPHGSTYRYILRAPSIASPASRMMGSDELCFECHAYDVYANPNAGASTLAASRFNAPAVEKGHAGHVGEESVPCYACHVTHGSTTQPFLLVTGRTPGIVTYTRTANGGTCTPTCHATESYTVNYAR